MEGRGGTCDTNPEWRVGVEKVGKFDTEHSLSGPLNVYVLDPGRASETQSLDSPGSVGIYKNCSRVR